MIANELAEQLNSITNGQIGIITSYDAWVSAVTSNLRNAFLRCGLTIANGTLATSYRRPYAAVFEGASGETTGEVTEVSYSSTVNMLFAEI